MGNSDPRYYESVQESRGWYFVDYKPPNPGFRFSTLNLSVLEDRDNDAIRHVMESESKDWVQRFPVPLMTTAFNRADDVIVVGDTSESSHLFSWLDEDRGKMVHRWEVVPDDSLPSVALNGDELDKIFSNITYQSKQELMYRAVGQACQVKRFRLILFAWLVVIPVVWALLEWSSEILGLLVLVFVVFKAIIQALRIFGYLPKTQRQIEKEDRDMKMQHYFFHCERNPEAFQRLKFENFRNEAIEDTQAKAHEIE